MFRGSFRHTEERKRQKKKKRRCYPKNGFMVFNSCLKCSDGTNLILVKCSKLSEKKKKNFKWLLFICSHERVFLKWNYMESVNSSERHRTKSPCSPQPPTLLCTCLTHYKNLCMRFARWVLICLQTEGQNLREIKHTLILQLLHSCYIYYYYF